MIRRDPEFLVYRWQENRWYYKTLVGLIPVTPGDGKWVLHIPGGRIAPWQDGIWMAIGRAWINKEHAIMYRANWESKLANPARVAVSPQGASEEQEQSWFQAMMAWGVNTVLSLKPGYDAKLLESNGRGYESFGQTIVGSEREFVIAVAGQEVTTDGGTGFANADIHKSIRADLIKETADGLAYTLNTQGLPPWIVARFGVEALEDSALVEWEVTPAKDQNAAMMSLTTTAGAIKALSEALKAHGVELDVAEVCQRAGVPIKGDVDGDGNPDEGALEDDEIEVDFEEDEEPEDDAEDAQEAPEELDEAA
jgi:phage gp29-like protein